MTTFAQLDKQADKWFNNQMRRRGFAVEKKFVFWRKRGPLYDMFMPQILTGGELLRVRVSIWSPWVDSENGEFETFPPDYCLIGGTLSDEFPEQMFGGQLLEIENEAAMDASLRKLLKLVDEHALPWFVTINSFDSYVSYVGDKGYHPTPERQEAVKRGIARAFEKEQFL